MDDSATTVSWITARCPICGDKHRIPEERKDQPCRFCARWAIVLATPLGPWVEDALCAQTDPEVFFPTRQQGASPRAAKRICEQCPVRLECLTDALRTGLKHGIWGGLTPPERKRLKKGSKVA